MAEKTGISWTDSTWSPVQAIRKDNGKRGCMCVKVSPGCKHCYSETIQLRNLPQHGTRWAGAKSSPINPARGKNDDMSRWPEALRVQQFPGGQHAG